MVKAKDFSRSHRNKYFKFLLLFKNDDEREERERKKEKEMKIK